MFARTKKVILASLLIVLLSVPLVLTGCAGGAAIPEGPALELSALMVPNTDLDVYVYFKQASPTKIPKLLIGANNDIMVESLALYGIARTEDKYTIGGGLTFSTAADATLVNSQLPKQAGLWTMLSDRTIYFIQGVGDKSQNLQSAISKRDFKPYNDTKALQEVALLPGGGTTKPFAIGIVKPNKALVDMVKRYGDPKTAESMETLFRWGNIELITFGVYASQQIDIADLVQRALTNTLSGLDLGMAASVKSGLPGFIVNLAAGRFLDSSGYAKVSLGQLTAYKVPLNAAGMTAPAYLNVEGNRVFLTASIKESYAQTLMTAIKR